MREKKFQRMGSLYFSVTFSLASPLWDLVLFTGVNPRGGAGAGGILKKVLYGKTPPPQGPTPYPKAFIRIIFPILTEDVPLSFMNCNNKTAKNKDSSIPDFSNGQFRFSSRYSSLVFVKKQHLDTVINIKVPLLYPLLSKWYPLHIPCLGRYREHSLGV